MARKGSSALVPVAPPKPRRVVGQAIQTNPMIAAVAQLTPAGLDDIQEEIETTEKYLAGLRAMHAVGSAALGLIEPPPSGGVYIKPEVVIEQLPAAEPDPDPVVEEAVAAVKEFADKKVEPRADGPSLTATLRAILTESPDMETGAIVAEAKKRGVTATDSSIRSNVYQVKSRIKIEKQKAAGTPPAAKPAPTPAARPAPPKTPEDEPDDKEFEGLPPKDSPHRAAAELTLRKTVAEYVFKKGLVAAGDIIRDCKVSPRIVNDFMNHPWFESHMQKWRLTIQGKNEGLDW